MKKTKYIYYIKPNILRDIIVILIQSLPPSGPYAAKKWHIRMKDRINYFLFAFNQRIECLFKKHLIINETGTDFCLICGKKQ